ncbi:hypothetical protein [Rhizobium nepotum]|jgi:hypothetical protein|uniref:hypothetical protein n=1 Tax=Rhizobium nepotum TaxID=1035271 RepID=UPI001269E246|nr:hypothetical protein [Rhizobium nepotum]
MDKAIHLNKRQYTKILGEQILLDRPLRFGILAEAAMPTAPSAQLETTEILSTQQVRQPVENSEPSVSPGNRRSSKILQNKSVSGAAISPHFLLFLKDICAFVAISTFVAATCLFSQEIAPKLSELVRSWGPSV